MLVELPIRSANLPLQYTQLDTQLCWRQLKDAPGAILELPAWQMRRYQRASQTGIHQRLHGRPVWNPLLLPPGAESPNEWARFNDTQSTIAALREFESGAFPEITAEMLLSLRDSGFSAIAVDAEPGGVLATRGALNRFRSLRVENIEDGVIRLPERSLSDQLGTPIDLGCALVWWLESDVPAPEPHQDGEQWREEATEWLETHPAPELDTLIEPTWNRLRQSSESSSTR